ncbi:Aste57867_700 [Aphanomyces stellatus]|uniref:Aste57867_700 protein n=1 Tax=Aphanomyces stellatus TaxID=120398 RepID=A0A485K5Y4_9STRA|nr:hypothetical protein As57867_000699 [Aphanomyces stellatus]VFT77924.1 Aste57867_700 [Aphanomyces stellatus]
MDASAALQEKWTLDARALDKDIQNIKVALAELDSVKTNKKTYLQKGNLFFLTKPEVATRRKEAELKSKQEKRHDVGLKRKQQPSA